MGWKHKNARLWRSFVFFFSYDSYVRCMKLIVDFLGSRIFCKEISVIVLSRFLVEMDSSGKVKSL